MATKAQILNRSFDALRISGLTVMATPSQVAQALVIMESTMSEMKYAKNWNIGYNFENVPNVNSQSGLAAQYENGVVWLVANRSAIQFGKEIPLALQRATAAATSAIQTIVSRGTLNPILPSRRMPVGSGNEIRTPSWRHYSTPVQYPPPLPDVKHMLVGEIQDFTETFAAWLGTNTIASIAVAVDPGLTLNSSSFSGPVVSYNVTAVDEPTSGIWRYVKITVTDSAGRIEIRLVSFEVLATPEVP